LAVIAICLVVAMVDLLGSTTMTFSNLDGSEPRTVNCGSTAFPKSTIDFQGSEDPVSDAANCAGQTSGDVALYAVLLAGAALVVVALTSRDKPTHRTDRRSERRSAELSGTPLSEEQQARSPSPPH
jgi:hypothetical protein